MANKTINTLDPSMLGGQLQEENRLASERLYRYADPFGYTYTPEGGGGVKTRDGKFIPTDQFLTYSQNASADVANMLGKSVDQLTADEYKMYVEPIVSGAKTSADVRGSYQTGVTAQNEADTLADEKAKAESYLDEAFAGIETGLQKKLKEQTAEQSTALQEAWARSGALTSGGHTYAQEKLGESAIEKGQDISSQLAIERARLKWEDIKTKEARDYETKRATEDFNRNLELYGEQAKAELESAERSQPGILDYIVKSLPGVGSILSLLFPPAGLAVAGAGVIANATKGG